MIYFIGLVLTMFAIYLNVTVSSQISLTPLFAAMILPAMNSLFIWLLFLIAGTYLFTASLQYTKKGEN